MKILHIGDLHFRQAAKYAFDQGKIIASLIDRLKSEKLDYVFFTGDLVNSGSKADDFIAAHNFLFKSLVEQLGIPISNIFICQGNHDINREKCSKAVLFYLDNNLKSNDDLNDFYDTKSADYLRSIKPSENYINYLKDWFSIEGDFMNQLYTVHKRSFQSKKLGFVTLNSAWLSSGLKERQDNRNLLIPTQVIKEALTKIQDCRIKILLVHHPFHNLNEFNYLEVEDIVHKEFNMMFSGHIHREKIESRYNGSNGIYCNTTQASLSYSKDDEIGFSIVDYDIVDESTIQLIRSSFNKKANRFIDLETVNIIIPVGAIKDRQNKLRQKVSSKFKYEHENANQLLIDYTEEGRLNFLESYTEPLIATKPEAENASNEESNLFSYNEILKLDSSYLIFGKDKCGKTSLLKKIQLNGIANYSTTGIIPFYIDYKDYEQRVFEFEKAFTHYYEINHSDAEEIFKNSKVVLLLDNLNHTFEVHEKVIQLLEKRKNFIFIACSDYSLSQIYFEGFDNLTYKKLYLKDLTRKEIRKYTDKTPHVKSDDKEVVLERIINLCKVLHLPVNYWIVALIVLIYKKSNDDYNKNLFGILDLCVDEMLSKKKLLASNKLLSFEQYKSICSAIAHYLLTHHRENVYSASYEELIGFISEYEKNDLRIVGESREIFEYLFEVGILKKKGIRYTFRLNGIFEYFLAYYIKEHEEFKNDIVNTDSVYLAFRNELEIYSGFNRNDELFLTKIFERTKKIFSPIIESYIGDSTIDKALVDRLGEAVVFADTVKKLQVSNPLTPAVQDALHDRLSPLEEDSDVHLKELSDTTDVDFDVLEKHLMILSRVFKNSDGIKNAKLVHEVFDYVLESFCILGFKLIENIEQNIRDLNSKEEKNREGGKREKDQVIGEALIRMVANIMPVVTSFGLYDGIGHPNISKLIENKLANLKPQHKDNQYKLFLLLFLLMDIDLRKNKDLIEVVFADITLPTLKVATLFKLNFYFAFKAHGKKDLEGYFRRCIQKAKLRLDNKQVAESVQAEIAFAKRKALTNRQRNK